jgi:hypothetical protein
MEGAGGEVGLWDETFAILLMVTLSQHHGTIERAETML